MAQSFEGFMLRLVEHVALVLRHYRSIEGRGVTYLMAHGRRESKMFSVPFEIMPPGALRNTSGLTSQSFSTEDPRLETKPLPHGPLEDAYPDHSCPYFDIID